MRKMTQADRVLMHLYRYRHVDPEASGTAPLEMTQDGVAMALGITRSNASLILGRMASRDLVNCRKVHAMTIAGRNLRKVYFLTTKGLGEAETVLDELDWDNPLPLDINHCRSTDFDELPREKRDTMGMVMALGRDVPRDSVPDGDALTMLPVDFRGNFVVTEATRERYLARADPDEVRRWHSMAADWCLDNNADPSERLRHLSTAGRTREAVGLVIDKRYSVIDTRDPALARTVDRLGESTGDGRVSAVASLMYMRLSDPARAFAAASRVDDPCMRGALRSEALLMEGRKEEALAEALDCYRGDAATSMALGKSMSANGRHEEAVVFLRRCRKSMTESGCLFRFDEALGCEAESYFEMGRRDLAVALMEAAACAATDPASRRMYHNRTEAMASEDRVGLEGVHV